jgi:hypothetical protein
VRDQHGIRDLAFFIALRLAERAVVDAQFGQGLARSKVKVPDEVIALRGRRVVAGPGGKREQGDNQAARSVRSNAQLGAKAEVQ